MATHMLTCIVMVKQAAPTIYYFASRDSQDKHESANAGNHIYPGKELYNYIK